MYCQVEAKLKDLSTKHAHLSSQMEGSKAREAELQVSASCCACFK